MNNSTAYPIDVSRPMGNSFVQKIPINDNRWSFQNNVHQTTSKNQFIGSLNDNLLTKSQTNQFKSSLNNTFAHYSTDEQSRSFNTNVMNDDIPTKTSIQLDNSMLHQFKTFDPNSLNGIMLNTNLTTDFGSSNNDKSLQHLPKSE